MKKNIIYKKVKMPGKSTKKKMKVRKKEAARKIQQRWRKRKSKPKKCETEKCKIEGRQAFKGYLSSYKLSNTENIKGFKGFELLLRFVPTLQYFVDKHKGIKINTNVQVKMVKKLQGKKYGNDASTELTDFYLSPPIDTALTAQQITPTLKKFIAYLESAAEETPLRGSGWVFDQVLQIDVQIARYRPLKASSYIELPPQLKVKKAIINVQNKDQQCFKWAVLSAIYPCAPGENAQRVSKYRHWSIDNADMLKRVMRHYSRLDSNSQGCKRRSRHRSR
jgi:hypothetical protein